MSKWGKALVGLFLVGVVATVFFLAYWTTRRHNWPDELDSQELIGHSVVFPDRLGVWIVNPDDQIELDRIVMGYPDKNDGNRFTNVCRVTISDKKGELTLRAILLLKYYCIGQRWYLHDVERIHSTLEDRRKVKDDAPVAK